MPSFLNLPTIEAGDLRSNFDLKVFQVTELPVEKRFLTFVVLDVLAFAITFSSCLLLNKNLNIIVQILSFCHILQPGEAIPDGILF
jgi:hypothetical protein